MMIFLYESPEKKVDKTLAKRIIFPAQDGKVRLVNRCDWKDCGNSTAELNEIWEATAKQVPFLGKWSSSIAGSNQLTGSWFYMMLHDQLLVMVSKNSNVCSQWELIIQVITLVANILKKFGWTQIHQAVRQHGYQLCLFSLVGTVLMNNDGIILVTHVHVHHTNISKEQLIYIILQFCYYFLNPIIHPQ